MKTLSKITKVYQFIVKMMIIKKLTKKINRINLNLVRNSNWVIVSSQKIFNIYKTMKMSLTNSGIELSCKISVNLTLN